MVCTHPHLLIVIGVDTPPRVNYIQAMSNASAPFARYLVTDMLGAPMARVVDISDVRALVRTTRTADHGAILVHGTYVTDDRGAVARVYDTSHAPTALLIATTSTPKGV